MIEIQGRLRALWCAGATAVVLFGGALIAPGSASAEQAWVRGEIRLNLRTGPGNNYRIVHTLTTGDVVSVVNRAEKWIQIQLPDGKKGWIPTGYLQPDAPPTIKLAQLQEEVVELRGKLETVTAERESLASTNESLSGSDAEQESQIAELTRENARLKGGQRWPEWIAGAGVLCVGMILGAIWRGSGGRRASPRIRL